MRVLKFLLQKEFRQIFRDPAILRIIFVMPVIQLIVLPLAADYEVKGIRIVWLDQDQSTVSRELRYKIDASRYFNITTSAISYDKALLAIEADKADLIVQVPVNFESALMRENAGELYLAANAINGVKGNLGIAYMRQIVEEFNRQIRVSWEGPQAADIQAIEVRSSNWYNPMMNYQLFMVPGILVILVTMVGTFLAALNIVKEKEIGTIEQINVTPVKKYQFILAKLIPFWILGLVILSIGLLIARLIYGIQPAGNLLTIYTFAAVYLLAILGLGLLVSNYTHTQQQAMLISFFLMMIFILLGGLYTSVDSMPAWAQTIVRFNPVSYFIEVMRMVVIKGSTLRDIQTHLLTMLGFAVLLNGWAVWSYRKRG
ncbi:MAG: ABC transporter permease [Chitinophagaceae bacterium]